MIEIILNNEQLNFCKKIGYLRGLSYHHIDTINSQNFLKDKKGWYRSFIGVVGELAYALHTGQEINKAHEIDKYVLGIGDDGNDFYGSVNVKCSDTINKPNLMFPKLQFYRKQSKYYVLTWYKEPSVFLVGWIDRQTIEENIIIKDYGYGETIFFPNEMLRDFE